MDALCDKGYKGNYVLFRKNIKKICFIDKIFYKFNKAFIKIQYNKYKNMLHKLFIQIQTGYIQKCYIFVYPVEYYSTG